MLYMKNLYISRCILQVLIGFPTSIEDILNNDFINLNLSSKK
ncbi:hypothetical protein DOY81_000005 [Sarcophaga bullata]|nr:hypothetical protein DOY81_000005 [Sarcophaga bullata]